LGNNKIITKKKFCQTHLIDYLCFLLLETLIVDEKPLTQEEKDAIEREKRLAEDEILARQLAESGGAGGGLANGILLKQVVAADNSCLFTSIGFILSGKVDTSG
jgi:ubiquitin thioesterase OTU1